MIDIGEEDDDLDTAFDEAEVREELTHKMRTEGTLVASDGGKDLPRSQGYSCR